MASKEVTDRSRSTTAAVSMLESYAEAVTQGATAVLSAFLTEGESMPDFGFGLTLVARWIDARRNELGAADEANARELADDAKPREDRNLFEGSAFDAIVATRDSVGANFGPTGLSALGLSEPCPTTPLGASRYGRAFVSALRDPEVVLPKPRMASLHFDRAAVADELEVQVAPLLAAVDAVALEKSQAEGTLAAKHAAIDANDDAFSVATGLGFYTFRLAGLGDIAGRIRQSDRKPGQLEKEPPAPPANPKGAG